MTPLFLALAAGVAMTHGYRFKVGQGEYWIRYIGWLALAGLGVELMWP